MFGKMKDMMQQMQRAQKLMKDENFKAFMSHPKVQDLFKDPEFQERLKTQNAEKITTFPKFAALMQDPEVAQLMSKIDPGVFFGK